MNNIFNYDNGFFRVVNKIVDGFWASILWLVFSLPIVTCGAATTAFYYTVHKSLRGNRGYVWRSFWSSFRSNFKQTTKIWLILLVIFAFLFADHRIMFAFLEQGSRLGVLYYFFYFLMFFWAVWCVYIFAYSARFENGLKETMKNAGIIALLNLPWSVVVLVLLLAGSLLVWLSPISVTFMPAVLVYLYDMFLEKIFRKYMTEEDLKKEEELDYGNRF